MDKRKSKRNKVQIPRHKDGEQFLKGPVIWRWFAHSGRLPGKSHQLGTIIWKRAGMSGSAEITVPQYELDDMQISRNSYYRALLWLLDAELIRAVIRRGRSTVITILDPPTDLPEIELLHERKVDLDTGQLTFRELLTPSPTVEVRHD